MFRPFPNRPVASRRRRAAVAALLLLVATHAAVAAPAVTASLLPLHALAAAVMDGVGTPRLLLRGDRSPHDFSLRPSEARSLRNSDLILWIGPELERPLARVLKRLPGVRQLAMLDAPGIQRLALRDQHDPGDHGHAHAPGERRDPFPVDPHVWLSPGNAIAMARHIAADLLRLDPANGMRYRDNLERLERRLQRLDRDLADTLAGVDGSFAVYHDAFHYFEESYGLHGVAVVTRHPDRAPGASHLHELLGELRGREVRCLFSEPQFQSRLVAMLGDETGVRHAVLDPLGADLSPGPSAYEELMRTLAKRFVRCMRRDADG